MTFILLLYVTQGSTMIVMDNARHVIQHAPSVQDHRAQTASAVFLHGELNLVV